MNHRVRKIDTNGIITTIAGNGQPGISGDGGAATKAAVDFPSALRFDSAGNLLILQFASGRIRKVTPAGIISTLVSPLVSPYGMDLDKAGNILVTEGAGAHRITRFTPDGQKRTTLAGTTQGFTDGSVASAQFNAPHSLRVDGDGNVLVADAGNGRIRRISADGSTVSTVAGDGRFAYTPDGTPVAQAYFQRPWGVAFSPGGALYISDEASHGVFRAELNGTLTRVAGTEPDGPAIPNYQAAQARSTPLDRPRGITFDRQGNLYIADAGILRVTPDGVLTKFVVGCIAGPGCGTGAVEGLDGAYGVVADGAGNLFVTTPGDRVVKVTPDGKITVLAGTGVAGFRDGPGAQAQFNGPFGIAIDPKGNLYVADRVNGRVRRIAPDGTVSTYGGPGIAQPQGVTVEADGSVLFTTIGTPTGTNVSRIRPDGTILQLTANSEGFSGDGGPATNAHLSSPQGVVTDAAGSIYVADRGNSRIRTIQASAPAFGVSPASVAFTVQAGDPAATPLPVNVISATTGLPFSIATSAPYITATASSTTAPATVSISVNPASLAPGTYTGTVTITPGAGSVAPVSVGVSVTVGAASPAQMKTDASGLSFSLVQGSGTSSKRLLVSNLGGGTLTFTARAATRSGGSWLSISPAQASVSAAVPVSVTVAVDPSGLSPGTYSGSVILTASNNDSVTVPVNLTVSSSRQLIQLSQSGVSFLAVAGGIAPPPQAISVVGTGQGSIAFTAKALLPAGVAAWLSVDPASGSVTPGQPAPTLTIRADPTGLAPGDYYGRIQISAPLADNSPREATVVLSVQPAASDPGPIVQPAGLVFTAVAGGPLPPSQSVTLTNLTPGSLSFGSAVATVDNGRYFQYQPASETLRGGSLQMEVRAVTTGLAAGVYRGAIVLVFSTGAIRNIGLLLVVAPSGTVISGGVAASQFPRAVSGCTPTQLLLQITSLVSNFTVPASWPTPLIANVVDDCGAPHVQGSVVSTFSNGDPPLPLLSLGDGRWAGTWVGNNKLRAAATINTVAENPTLKIRGTFQISGSVTGNANPPTVSGGAILSSSSYQLQGVLAPGDFISIFGGFLASATAQATALPLASQLADAQVLVAGRLAPILFSSAGQINAILPLGTPFNVPVQVLVSRGGQLSVPVDIAVAAAAPGVFSTSGTGQGQGHLYVVSATGLKLADPAAPAQAGDTLVMYCTGLGSLDSTVPDGTSAPLDHLVQTVNPVTVSFGSVSVPAAFAGLSPGFAVGLYQVNVVVPKGLTPGDKIPVAVSVAGQTSPAVTIAVR